MSHQIILKTIKDQMNKENIAVLTTLINKDLYKKSAQLFPKDAVKYVIDGSNNMFGIESLLFMMKKLKGKGIEWLVMSDEDVLFINPDGIYTIIEYMKKNNYILAGVRDGGQIPNRIYNPYVINTFFSIINFKELEKNWMPNKILKNQYILDNEFNEDLSELKEEYDVKSLYEPYYCFYFWLRRINKKLLFLNAEKPFDEDDKTTLVYDTDGNKLLYHTWYARVYGKNEKHTKRIDTVFNLIDFEDKIQPSYIYLKDHLFIVKYNYNRLLKRIKIKLNKYFKNI